MDGETNEGRRIACLGTGIMGAPMARHLQARGHAVFAWDRDSARSRELENAGVSACSSAASAVAQADVVITMLPDAETTEQVAQDALSEFTGLWIQSATVGIAGTERLLQVATEVGATMIDCPMLGTRSSAEEAQLTALASGPEEVEPECRHLLAAYSPRVLWLGAAGAGTRLKLVMNSWVIGLTQLTAETVTLAEGLGFGAETFLGLIAGGPLDVTQAHLKARLMGQRDFPPALPLRLAAKDAGLIQTAAEDAGLDLPVARAVARAFGEARDAGYGDLDMAAIYLALAPKEASGETNA